MKKSKYTDLVTVPNEYKDRDYEIKISVPEFNCVCPQTGLPDFGTIKINYIPNEHIVELKSLKLYIIEFRSIGIFHEDVTNKIFDDLKLALNPRQIEVIGEFNPRGGILTEVKVSTKI